MHHYIILCQQADFAPLKIATSSQTIFPLGCIRSSVRSASRDSLYRVRSSTYRLYRDKCAVRVRRRLDADWSTLDLLSDGTCPDKQRMSSVYSVLRIWSGSEQMHTIFPGYILTTSKDQQINQF